MMRFKMLTIWSMGLTIALGFNSVALAKKARPPEPPPAAEDSAKDKDDDGKSKEDVETGKARAKEFEKGKELDKVATESKLGKLTGQVSGLDKALKASGAAPADAPPTRGRRGRGATTQPATTQSTKKSSADADADAKKAAEETAAPTGRRHRTPPPDAGK